MRIVLCDEDGLLRDSVEALIPKTGHELVGVADTTARAVNLIDAARPDAVVFDMSLGYNTDFDVIEASEAVGAKVVVFSYNADDSILSQYPVRPTVIQKPELSALELVLRRLELDETHRVVEAERRRRESRQLATAVPTGISDAAAFYEALNQAVAGDAMISIEIPEDATYVAELVLAVMRHDDRLLATASTVRILLVSGGEIGITSFLGRLTASGVLPSQAVVHSVVLEQGEAPIDAFERLKTSGERRHLPA